MNNLERSLASIMAGIAPLPQSPVECFLIPRSVAMHEGLVTFERRDNGSTMTLRASNYIAARLRNEIGRPLKTRVASGTVDSYYDHRSGRVA